MTGQHTIHVTIDDGCRESEGDTADGSGCIVAHPFQLTDFLECLREMPESNNLASCEMKVTK